MLGGIVYVCFEVLYCTTGVVLLYRSGYQSLLASTRGKLTPRSDTDVIAAKCILYLLYIIITLFVPDLAGTVVALACMAPKINTRRISINTDSSTIA